MQSQDLLCLFGQHNIGNKRRLVIGGDGLYEYLHIDILCNNCGKRTDSLSCSDTMRAYLRKKLTLRQRFLLRITDKCEYVT